MSVNCKHWSDCGVPSAGCCSLGLHHGRPSHATCGLCDKVEPASRGLGDTVAKITKAVGIKPCGGCKNRQYKLNQLIP